MSSTTHNQTTTTTSTSNNHTSKQQSVVPFNSVKDLYVTRKLGSGKTAEVRKCYDHSNNIYALKIYKDASSSYSDQQCEVAALAELDHHNILKKVHSQDKYLVLEFCKNGELFDFVSASEQMFPEELARLYFRQLVDAVEHCHKKGFAHRDIKLENLLLDENFDLKLSDFAFATRLEKGVKLSRVLGTEGYMAPEIVMEELYQGESVDIFAMGVTLFCMSAGFPPYYKKAWKLDPYYKYYIENRLGKYWETIERKQGVLFSKEFKQLISGMLAYKPEERLTLTEIKAHSWFKGPVPTKEQTKTYMGEVKKKIK